MKSVLIAILTWNNGKELLNCLKSLEPYMSRYDFLLVDNASTDHSVEMAQKVFPDLEIRRNSVNLGAAGGYNACLTYARQLGYQYLLLVDGDVTLANQHLEEFQVFLESHPGISAVCPKITISGSKLLWSAGGRLNPYLVQAAVIGNKQEDRGQFNQSYQVDFSPNPWMLRLPTNPSDLQFSTEYGRYGFEDVDFFYNLRKKGGRIHYLPSVVFSQNPSSSPTRNSPHYHYLITRNRILFAKKNLFTVTFFLIFVPYFVLRKILLEGLFFLCTGQINTLLSVLKGVCWHFATPNYKLTLDQAAQ